MYTERLKNAKVLIVDDQERNIFALQSYLESREMNVTVAHNGRQALTLLKEGFKPAIILLDMMMPVMDGFETLTQLQENEQFKKIPVVAVTARTMKGDKEKCIDAGAWDYISKPINMPELEYKLFKLIPKNGVQ